MIPISFELKELHVFALSERRHNKNSLISRLLCVPLTTDRRLALIVRGDESLYVIQGVAAGRGLRQVGRRGRGAPPDGGGGGGRQGGGARQVRK